MFSTTKYDVEGACSIFAYDFVTIPPKALYGKLPDEIQKIADQAHIYLICSHPKPLVHSVSLDGLDLTITLSLNDKVKSATFPIPAPGELIQTDDHYYIRLDDGSEIAPRELDVIRLAGKIEAKVLYIGQAYGKDGNRKALDRLLAHEKLQKIMAEMDHESSVLSLILLTTRRNHMTLFSPSSIIKDKSVSVKRISNNFEFAEALTEAEEVSLYEAGLIRYFQPKYNVEFANSFPSTNQRILRRCYEKDQNAIIAEICMEQMPFILFSDSVDPRDFHIAKHALHVDKDRDAFFAVGTKSKT